MRLRSAEVFGAAVVALIGIGAVAPSALAHHHAAVQQAAARQAAAHRARAQRAASAHVTHVTINGARVGPAFQGIGAISGGGGNSRLLIDYKNPQRQQILNYMFKPGYGADLQILKLEIGGDGYATDGSEPSIEQTKGQINCQAGYEFWLAAQAKALNPNIQLYGLQWNAPNWVGGGAQNGWTSADISYIIDWLNCARQHYGLTIKYIGGWNEHLPHGITPAIMRWFIQLRQALNAAGYGSTQIAAVDSFAKVSKSGDIADFLAAHPAFRNAVSVLAYHNLCRYPATGNNCAVPHAARASGKPIWESEIGALRETTGIAAMARSLINGFNQVGATGFIEWPLMASMPAFLPEEDRGLVFAPQPWSGHYTVNQMAWVLAQTTEFTQPGWHHVNGAGGLLGTSDFGTYTTYESPSHENWSLVAQTSQAARDQTIAVHVDPKLPASAVHVWSTNINSPHSGSWFFNRGTVHPSGGTFRYTLKPGFIYSFTTTTGQVKGNPSVPAAKAQSTTYSATRDASNEPTLLGPQDGTFEYLPGSSTTFAQTTVNRPVFWQNPVSTRFPYAILGDNGWKNYTVKATVEFTGNGQNAGVISRFNHPKANGIAQQFFGYQLTVSQTGVWKLIRNTVGAKATTLESGTLGGGALPLNNPVTVSLTANGTRLTGSVDGTAIKPRTDKTYPAGDAGISAGGWYQVHFTGLTVSKP